jgi:CRP-like cAMP-binding protein
MPSNFPAEMLRDIPLFRNLTVDEIEEIIAVANDCEYAPGREIVSEGGYDRALYAIFDGEVEVVLPSPAFEETPLVKLGPGSVFGESAFFHASPHIATVRCLAPVLGVRLAREQFERLLERSSLAAFKLAANAAALLAERLQATDRWIEEMIQKQQDALIAASWREFRHRTMFGHALASYGPVGTICTGA